MDLYYIEFDVDCPFLQKVLQGKRRCYPLPASFAFLPVKKMVVGLAFDFEAWNTGNGDVVVSSLQDLGLSDEPQWQFAVSGVSSA